MGRLGGHEQELAGDLPMGMRQRLALGCALVHRPQVLFLDEPTSGVDPVGRRQFWDILFRLSREEGVAILVTTHYMSEAEHCDRVALMFAGRIVADAPPSDLKRQVEEEAGRVLEVDTDRPVLALDRLSRAGFEGAALFGRRIHLFSKSPEGIWADRDPRGGRHRGNRRDAPPPLDGGRFRLPDRRARGPGPRRPWGRPVNLRRVLTVAQKEGREILRDRIVLLLAFLLPPMLFLVDTYGSSREVAKVACGVVDHDDTTCHATTRPLSLTYFRFKGHLPMLSRRRFRIELQLVIVFPRAFRRAVFRRAARSRPFTALLPPPARSRDTWKRSTRRRARPWTDYGAGSWASTEARR
jgi:hypothetical protein